MRFMLEREDGSMADLSAYITGWSLEVKREPGKAEESALCEWATGRHDEECDFVDGLRRERDEALDIAQEMCARLHQCGCDRGRCTDQCKDWSMRLEKLRERSRERGT